MVVELWTTERGSGAPFVLLHPGGTDARALEPLLEALGPGYRLITPEQRAHGHTPDVGELTFAAMAEDTVAFIESLDVAPVHLLGYSDGAIVALHVALARPDLVADLVFAAAPATVDGWYDGVLGVDPPEFMADAYGEVSPDGREHWPVVVEKMARMHVDSPRIDANAARRAHDPDPRGARRRRRGAPRARRRRVPGAAERRARRHPAVDPRLHRRETRAVRAAHP